MLNSPECQPIADTIADLNAQEQAKLDALVSLTGVDRWKAIQEVGTIRQQIADQQALLDACEKQHADDLTTTVVVFDIPGNSGTNRIARIWQLTTTGQTVKQTVTVQEGVATFAGLLASARQSFGITIEEADSPTVNGPDFRSGPIPPIPAAQSADPASRVEIVILDPIVITADSLSHAVPSLPILLSRQIGQVGTIGINVNALQFFVDATVSITGSGTISAIGMTSPFTFATALHIAPTFSMVPNLALEISPSVSPTLTMPGIVGTIVQELTTFVSSSLSSATVQPLSALFNRLLTDQVLASLGLRALPSGSVLSVRQLIADAGKLSVTTALAAFGTTLSNFQPPPVASVPRIVAFTLQPASVSTSDPTNRFALGSISLDGPAPTGGVTVVLSSDQPAAQISPSSLIIAEGGTTGTFTVTGVGQPLMPAGRTDATVTAALGDQTMTAPVSISQDAPVTPTANLVSGIVTPETIQLEQDIFQLINQRRTAAGLPVFAADTFSADQARSHCLDMASGQVPFGDDGFEERFALIGSATGHPGIAEIPASGQQTAEQAVQSFSLVTDQKNQAYILGPYARLGVGAARSQAGTNFFTIIFS